MGRKGKAFCERLFALHRQQPVKDKQILDLAPHGKNSADVHGMHWVRSNSWVIKRGAVWLILLSHSKTINAKVLSFADLYTKRSNQEALQFWCVVNSLKIRKTSKGVFWYPSARPRPFARFAQWLIRPCYHDNHWWLSFFTTSPGFGKKSSASLCSKWDEEAEVF